MLVLSIKETNDEKNYAEAMWEAINSKHHTQSGGGLKLFSSLDFAHSFQSSIGFLDVSQQQYC